MNEEQRYFLNPDAVSRHLYCSICQDVFNEPQRAPCGHSFCKKCIMTWLRQKKTCPEDRMPLSSKQLHYDFILANIIGDQMVACPYRADGCDHVGKLELLTSHTKSCTFNPINVPDFLKDSPSNSTALRDVTSRLSVPDSSPEDEGKLPTPAKPSLKMRLFIANEKRDLLRSMFDQREGERGSTSSQQDSPTDGRWLNRTNGPKKRRVIEID